MPNVPISTRHRLVLIGRFRVSSYERFYLFSYKKHETPPNKFIVTKFIRHTLPVFNNKALLDLILTNIKAKNKKRPKSCKPTNILMIIFDKSIPAGSENKTLSSAGKKGYKVSN